MKLSLGFSPCPNDTFIFDALVNRKIDTGDFEFEVILEDVQTLFPKAPELLPSKPPNIDGDLLKVYEAISSRETSIDEIIQRSGIGAGSATVALLQLEVRHLVKQLPGKYFVKLL